MTTRARSRQATPEPRPWAEIKARLERHDAAAGALQAFLRGAITVHELEEAFESATGGQEKEPACDDSTQRASVRSPSRWPSNSIDLA
jgi:hypothetical protein